MKDWIVFSNILKEVLAEGLCPNNSLQYNDIRIIQYLDEFTNFKQERLFDKLSDSVFVK